MQTSRPERPGFKAKVLQWSVILLGSGLTLFQLYTGLYGTYVSQIQGAIHVGLAVSLVFMLFPFSPGADARRRPSWLDFMLALVALAVNTYIIFNYDRLVTRALIIGYSETDFLVALTGIVLVLEATRRCVGLPIVLIAIVAILYSVYGNFAPVFAHPGISWERMVTDAYLTTSGVFGTPIQVSSTYIYLFLLFGVILVKTNIGEFFGDLAFLATGRFTGGTAKAAVFASALQGMVSGSSISNTVASGSFTIPMMKRAGFKPEFAGATEASASTGGQIMPPVMGAAAFIMAAYTGVAYNDIMVMAAVPALLYFIGVFAAVHFFAAKMKIGGLSRQELPDSREIRKNLHLIIPLVAIVGCLLIGRTATFAAFTGIIAALLVSIVRKKTRLSLKELLSLGEEGARTALPVIAACATAGIIAGTVTKTGLGAGISKDVLALSGGAFLPVLLLTMLASFVLGMGLPTTANYIVTASIAAPILVNNFDIPVISAHLFVFYFGVLADITPPVCLAAYAAAGIAKANPMKTGLYAFVIAISGFIVPFVIVTQPAMILVDATVTSFLTALLTTIAGLIFVSAGLMGYFLRPLGLIGRAVFIFSGILAIVPDLWLSAIGIGIVAVHEIAGHLRASHSATGST
ncbi:TRAP transporter permease [Limibacillus halophilus]|uniref:TRAP transporter 4TM/12TM fusion protein n=1 Tax=Limibacillus halophilus TaxID=1579333 RepID=A0A839ST55_9PROT|nr:TRAP transporter permease [Limibacillus halophilus]MBB3064536.1 TRAP transporter 4TM/12TM fusion protein [Limibacillus halophilus]